MAFRKEDWDAGKQGAEDAVAVGQTTTGGTWAWSLMLDPGQYVLRFEKPGEYGPDTVEITVESPPQEAAPIRASTMRKRLRMDDFEKMFGEF